MYLETNRMIVRNFTVNDVNDLHEIFGDDKTMEQCEPAYSFENTEKFLNDFCIGRKSAFAAVLKETDKVVGYILFNPIEDGIYEIGWIFNRKYWEHGFAYESCSELVKYAFNKMNVHKIFAEAIDPIKSVNLMKKLGMKQEGVQKSHTRDNLGNWADLYLYGILKTDYIQHVL